MHQRLMRTLLTVCGFVLMGCPPPAVDGDAGPPGRTQDAGRVDTDDDGGSGVDAGSPDAGAADAGSRDAGAADAGAADAGAADAGAFDAGAPDAGPFDAGPLDAGLPPSVDLARSALVALSTEAVWANGEASITLQAELVLSDGAPGSALAVRFDVVDGPGVFLQANEVQTNIDGIAQVDVQSVEPGSHRVRASANLNGSWQTFGEVEVHFDRCVSDEAFYEESVLGPAVSKCIGCHNAYGRLTDNLDDFRADYNPDYGTIQGKFTLHFPDDVIDPVLSGGMSATQLNLETLRSLSFEFAGLPYFLAKATNTLPHGGGAIVEVGDTDAQLLTLLSERLRNEDVCLDPTPRTDLFDFVDTKTPQEVHRALRQNLIGDYLTKEEYDALPDTEDALHAAFDDIMETRAFRARLFEHFNDLLLTDSMLLVETDAIQTLPYKYHPRERRWFFFPQSEGGNNTCRDIGAADADEVCCNEVLGQEFCQAGKKNIEVSLSKEAAAIIVHVVLEDRPFGEILTAPYTMMNPYTAAAYGIYENDHPAFQSGPDWMTSYFEAEVVAGPHNLLGDFSIDAVPHAGILTTGAFLRRFPNTATNRNRHRARSLYAKFLAIDVMEFLQLTLDPDEQLPANVFTEARSCAACHAALDPVAAAMQNIQHFQGGGERFEPKSWFPGDVDMRPPGFAGTPMPEEFVDGGAARWLGQQMVADPRFALAAVHNAFELLTGVKPLTLPRDPSVPEFAEQTAAYHLQSAYLAELAHRFRTEMDMRYKTLLHALIDGPYVRAKGLQEGAPDAAKNTLRIAGVGAHLLATPEQIDRKTNSLFGVPYTTGLMPDGTNRVLDLNEFRLLMGGIDSDQMIVRSREPSPVSQNITRRYSVEMACLAVPQDFSIRDQTARRFFRSVDTTTEPTAENEAEIRADLARIQFLFWGPQANPDDVSAAYALLQTVWMEGKARVAVGDEPADIPSICVADRPFEDRGSGEASYALPPDAAGENVVVAADADYVIRAWMATLSFLMTDHRFWVEP